MINEPDITELMGRFKFCDCGNPEAVLKLMRDALRHILDDDNNFILDKHGWLVVYVLESHGYLDHGSNIGCCWLTRSGKELLNELEELKL